MQWRRSRLGDRSREEESKAVSTGNRRGEGGTREEGEDCLRVGSCLLAALKSCSFCAAAVPLLLIHFAPGGSSRGGKDCWRNPGARRRGLASATLTLGQGFLLGRYVDLKIVLRDFQLFQASLCREKEKPIAAQNLGGEFRLRAPLAVATTPATHDLRHQGRTRREGSGVAEPRTR